MEQVKSKEKSKLDILLILALFVLARICCPALSNIPVFDMAFTFLYGAAFIFFFVLTVKEINVKDFALLASALFYTAYVILRSFIAGNGLFARDPFNAYIIVFLTTIYIWSKYKSPETKALLFRFITFALIFDYVYSIWVLWQDPGASRRAAALSVLGKSPADILNAVGSFDAVYGGLSVIVILLCMLRELKKYHTKDVMVFCVLIFAIVFIIMSEYATALSLLLLALALFLGGRNKTFSAILVIFLILTLVFHRPVGQWIMDMSYSMTYSETIMEKMNDFGYMLKNFEAAGTYAGNDGRASKMIYSWQTFLKYPLLGGIGRRGAKVYGHCELLDFPGNFGLVGCVFLVGYFVRLYKNVRDELPSKEMRTGWKIVLFLFVISAALNPSLYSLQMMPIILMMPLSASYLEFRKERVLGDIK